MYSLNRSDQTFKHCQFIWVFSCQRRHFVKTLSFSKLPEDPWTDGWLAGSSVSQTLSQLWNEQMKCFCFNPCTFFYICPQESLSMFNVPIFLGANKAAFQHVRTQLNSHQKNKHLERSGIEPRSFSSLRSFSSCSTMGRRVVYNVATESQSSLYEGSPFAKNHYRENKRHVSDG